MEFGIFLAGEVLGDDQYNIPEVEHFALKRDLERVIAADRAGFKYAWISEHHALTQYSHLSASETFIPYALALTDRIHVGSGIHPLNPAANHPVRLAERVAMADHLSNGRFEFGTGRGAGSWEVGTFNLDPADTKEIWNEVVKEFKRMWESDDPRMGSGPGYSHDGAAFSVPPRNVLPKPYGGGKTHPAMWCAVANVPTFQKCGENGLGALAFGLLGSARQNYAPYVEAYKQAIATAVPVGQFVNDNMCIVSMAVCLDDGQAAREAVTRSQTSYYRTLVFYYHDTFPMPEWGVRWPDRTPEPTLSDVSEMADKGMILCGSPDDVIDQVREYESAGVDTILLALASIEDEAAMETIRVFGEHVIPKFDKDPLHRTSRARYGNRAEAIVGNEPLGAQAFDSSKVGR
jgi:alkanesulfonate monooxygenase SsuD/methylene tetrahydromethanopterin reductase-like flavin-dependent oxidoreductase (luciferase family)